MKNYKLLKFDQEILKSMGFIESFFSMMKKKYFYNRPYEGIELYFADGKPYIYFYDNRFLLPCELESVIGKENEALLKKVMADDLKEFKKRGLIK